MSIAPKGIITKKARFIKDAKDVGIIAAGGLASGAGIEGIRAIRDRPPKKKKTVRKTDFNIKRAASAVGVIAAGDLISEAALDEVERRKRRKRRVLGQTRSGLPGDQATTMAAKVPGRIPHLGAYTIARRNLRGKKPKTGIKKILMAMFTDKRKTIDMDPEKKTKVAKDIAGTAAGAGVAYAGYRIGKAAKMHERLAQHVGTLATQTNHKVNAHLDYLGDRADQAIAHTRVAAKAGKRTATAWHPRVLLKGLKKKIGKGLPFIGKRLSSRLGITSLRAKHQEEEDRSIASRHGARIAGAILALGGSLAVAAHYRRPATAVAHAGEAVTKQAKAVIERRPRGKKVLPPITDIKRIKSRKKGGNKPEIKRKKSALEIIRSARIEFAEQGHESGTGRFGTVADIRPALRSAQKHARVAKRGGEVAQDIHDQLRGVKKDPRKKRFWDKEWFKTAVITGAVGGGILAHRAHAHSKGARPLFSALRHAIELGSPGIVKAAVEGIIDAAGLGEATNPDGTKKKKKKNAAALQAATDANPDPGMTHNSDLVSIMRIVRLGRLLKLNQFYGTSDGVTKSWDTRGRSERAPRTAHWWTHSPTKNSVRVVRSHSEQGPRTRRKKKLHEKSSFKDAAIKVLAGTAAAAGGVALYKHGQVKKLTKANAVLMRSSKAPPVPDKKFRRGRSSKLNRQPGG